MTIEKNVMSNDSNWFNHVDHQAMAMAIRREQLNASRLERQMAVCSFPLVVASMANDMRRMIGFVGSAGETPASIRFLEELENRIRDEYRKQFGDELGSQMSTPLKTFAPDGLIQVHWQNRSDLNVTTMVAQGGEFATAGEMMDWINETLRNHAESCPEGWGPMICDSTSSYFWMQAEA